MGQSRVPAGSSGDRGIVRSPPEIHAEPWYSVGRLEEGERRVLVVDDDPYYLDIIPSVLSREDEYVVLTASTGFAGAIVVEHNRSCLSWISTFRTWTGAWFGSR